MLRELNNDLEAVDPEDAFLDKVELKVQLGTVSMGNDNELNEGYFDSISRRLAPSVDTISGETVPYDPTLDRRGMTLNASGWLFNRATGVGAKRRYSINKGSRTESGYYPRPLFGGEMSIYRANGGSVELLLHTNFCRFCHYNMEHYVTIGSRFPRGLAVWTHEIIQNRSVDGEIALDDSHDNWLQRGKIDEMTWSRVMFLNRIYLEHIERQIRWDLRNADGFIEDSEQAGHFNYSRGDYTLSYCEVAWEFTHDSPVQAVNELYPLLREYYGREMQRSRYTCTEGVEGFSSSCRVKLPDDNELAIYAKTNRRVRIEVRYRLRHNGSPAPLRVKTASTQEELQVLFSQLRDHAANVINGFLAYMRSQRAYHAGYRFTVKEFLDRVYAATKEATREAVLRSLIEDKRLPNNLGRGEFLEVARGLRDAGVVRIDGRRNYRLTSEYRYAAEQLNSIGIFRSRIYNDTGEYMEFQNRSQ